MGIFRKLYATTVLLALVTVSLCGFAVVSLVVGLTEIWTFKQWPEKRKDGTPDA